MTLADREREEERERGRTGVVREVPKECAEYLVIWQFYGIFAIVCARVKFCLYTRQTMQIFMMLYVK